MRELLCTAANAVDRGGANRGTSVSFPVTGCPNVAGGALQRPVFAKPAG